MIDPDEPALDHGSDSKSRPKAELDVRRRIQRLVEGQPYGVLCTQGEGQPYGSLVAFAFSESLEQAVFATPITTRKYRLLSACEHVALVPLARGSRDDLEGVCELAS